MNRKSAITAIERAGALLVFPIGNRKEPASIWSHFFPRTPMRWEWDESGDDRVANLWHLRGDLSTTRKVVYTKWYQGRATYFSRDLFTALLRALNPQPEPRDGLGRDARGILEILDGESPLSTKELKRMSGLQGRAHEGVYQKALSELWSRLLIVAFGEVDDGAFPSLAVGSTRVLFEDLWSRAFRESPSVAEKAVAARLSETNPFHKHFVKLLKKKQPAKKGRAAPRGARSVVRFDEL